MQTGCHEWCRPDGMKSMIRPAVRSDAAALLEIYAPYVVGSSFTFELEAPSVAEFGDRIEQISAKTAWLVCERGGMLAGYAYASEHRSRKAYQWSVEVSVYVREAFRNQGVARELYGILFERLRQLGYFNAYAGITLPNGPSVALHESLAFESIGVYRSIGYKLGAWHDVGWWQLQLQPYVENPPQPNLPTLG